MRCPSCQTGNPPEARFCCGCATPLAALGVADVGVARTALHSTLSAALSDPFADMADVGLEVTGGHQTAAGDPNLGRLVVGKYRIRARLGQGGFGSVYRAEHVTSGKEVALKLPSHGVLNSRGGRARFLKEAEAGQDLVLFSGE